MKSSESPYRSPIMSLEKAIAASAYTVAPEREAAYIASTANVSIIFAAGEKRFGVRVNTETYVVTLPIATLEYVWACTHMLLRLYAVFEEKQALGYEAVSLAGDPEFCTRLDLFNWALNNMLYEGTGLWPQDAPQPSIETSSCTDELFLVAIGWILHHEIAHLRRNHAQAHRIYTNQQEREADADAVGWVLGACADAQMRTKRQLGMAIALLSMQFLDEPQGSGTYLGTHPPTSARIFDCLNDAKVDLDGLAYTLCAIAMHFHLGQHSLTSELDGDSFQTILDGALLAFRTGKREVSS